MYRQSKMCKVWCAWAIHDRTIVNKCAVSDGEKLSNCVLETHLVLCRDLIQDTWSRVQWYDETTISKSAVIWRNKCQYACFVLTGLLVVRFLFKEDVSALANPRWSKNGRSSHLMMNQTWQMNQSRASLTPQLKQSSYLVCSFVSFRIHFSTWCAYLFQKIQHRMSPFFSEMHALSTEPPPPAKSCRCVHLVPIGGMLCWVQCKETNVSSCAWSIRTIKGTHSRLSNSMTSIDPGKTKLTADSTPVGKCFLL